MKINSCFLYSALIFIVQSSCVNSFDRVTAMVMALKRNVPVLRREAETSSLRSYKEALLGDAEMLVVAEDSDVTQYDYIKIRFRDGVSAELIKMRGLQEWLYRQKGRALKPLPSVGNSQSCEVIYVGLQDFDRD